MARPTLISRQTQALVLDDGTVQLDIARLESEFHPSSDKPKDSRFRFKSALSQRWQESNQHQEHVLGEFERIPRIEIAILVTGSRGDVQPFVALGKVLQAAPYSHRVRIGTHPIFRQFVRENGLEFFSIGGDPARLMSYMVRNPGILPNLATIRAGEIGQRKAELEEMLTGAWRACTEAHDGSPDDQGDAAPYTRRPFIADCIISNPPTYGSLHIAERLSVPLHMVFTMPWSPTTSFPHPLARLNPDRDHTALANYLSYTQMELLTWLGLADIINRFRRRVLMLDPIDPLWGTTLMSHLKVPHTYCWSPALISKPADWGEHITVSGFIFLPLASSYVPDPSLQAFLDAGEPPIYIGFGSIVVDDPEAFSSLIYDAIKKAGVRALVSRGWSNVGATTLPDDVFLLNDVPHDWLFKHVSAVVHHGGAGTCAIGLAMGKPTVIVPFFGDQFWWADMVWRAGAGPKAVPYTQLTADALAHNISAALRPEIRIKANELSMSILQEDGAEEAAEHFHTAQGVKRLSCSLCPDRVAILRVRKTRMQLSGLAAAVMFKNRRLKPADVKLIRHKRWYVEEGAPEPFSGAVAALTDAVVACVTDLRYFRRVSTRRQKHIDTDVETSDKMETAVGGQSGGYPTSARGVEQSYRRLAKHLAANIACAPINLLYNVANGFHNLPAALLNDETVRTREHITGVRSGLAVAGTQIAYGFYDGITGLAVHPYRGYQRGCGRKGGRLWGTAKGIGVAMGGVVSRSGSVAFAIPGYGLKGVEQQLRQIGRSPDRLPQLANNILDRVRESVADKEGRTRRKAVQREWLRLARGHPIMQSRVLQSFEQLDEMLENRPEEESDILQRWDALTSGGG